MGTRTPIWAGAAAFVTALGSMLVVGPMTAGASSPADQGVTAKTIAVGLPYVNFAALQSLGVTINDGSFPDAYNAVIAGINAKGGIDGRKLVAVLQRHLFLYPMSPVRMTLEELDPSIAARLEVNMSASQNAD